MSFTNEEIKMIEEASTKPTPIKFNQVLKIGHMNFWNGGSEMTIPMVNKTNKDEYNVHRILINELPEKLFNWIKAHI